MKWMVDFDEAEAKGMALRIPCRRRCVRAGLDSLIVFGVATSVGADAAQRQLADLLDAHHYTDGLEFLRLGTPTNNTDDRRAGYEPDDPGPQRSFADEVASDPAAARRAIQRDARRRRARTAGRRIAPVLGRIGVASTSMICTCAA